MIFVPLLNLAERATEAPKPAEVIVPEKVDVLITSTSCAADTALAQSIKGE